MPPLPRGPRLKPLKPIGKSGSGLLSFYDILKQVKRGQNIVEDGWASPFRHTLTQKASKTLVFLPFDWCSRTYWQMDGQSLLTSCVSVTKKIQMLLPFVCFDFRGFNITPDKRSRWQKYVWQWTTLHQNKKIRTRALGALTGVYCAPLTTILRTIKIHLNLYQRATLQVQTNSKKNL